MALKGFAGFAIRKVVGAVITIFAIVCFNFVLFRIVPGDPVRLMFRDPRVSAQKIHEMYERFGLTGSLWDQFIAYLRQLFLHGDLGYSFARRAPVTEVIIDRVPQTLLLVLTALFIAVIVGTMLGAIAGWKTGTKLDSAIISVSLTLYSIPIFVMGIIILLVLSFYLGLFPLSGMYTIGADLTGWAYWKDVLWHMFLPTCSIVIWYVGEYIIVTRSSMQDVLDQDYIIAARAKGIKESAILLRHALRNAILPVVTITGVNVAFAISGVIEAETVFGWPGMGRLVYASVMSRDYPVLQGLFLVFAVLVVLANLVVDLIYGYIDPRIKVRSE
ncbi:MAG: ABC transporter permease [Dehalococcoidia bacterium]|nr:ABC transporter permease [Dehalococcoidia bacterium]RLC63177.1 MAG: ABC transporter permease [Chloroflexota bacterium]